MAIIINIIMSEYNAGTYHPPYLTGMRPCLSIDGEALLIFFAICDISPYVVAAWVRYNGSCRTSCFTVRWLITRRIIPLLIIFP